MNKAYNPIDWVNNETSLNDTNLNKMSNAISTIDDRVVNHDRVLSGFSASVNQALEASKTAVSASTSAVESAEKAEEALKNAEAVVGVGIATADKAGLTKADDVHIESDGTLKFIEQTTEKSMPNSHKGRLLLEEIGGVSEQGSTTGAQLFDAYNEVTSGTAKIAVSNNVITLTAAVSGTYRQSGYVVTDVPYVVGDYFTVSVTDISSTNSAGAPYIVCRYLDDENAIMGKFDDANSVDSNNKVRTFCIEEIEGCTKIALILVVNRNGTASAGDTATITDLMVNSGSTALPWEPYTGGQASPNPDYPQEIKSVVVSGVKTHNANFFDEKILVADDGRGNFVTWKDGKLHFKNTTGTYFIVKRTISLPKGHYYFMKYTSGSIYAYIGLDIGEGVNYSMTEFTLEETTSIIVKMTSNNQTTAGEYYANVMITTVKDAEYAPYTESSITLSEPIELCGIGDVQDVIDVEAGAIRRSFKKVVFDGSSDEIWNASGAVAKRYTYSGLGGAGAKKFQTPLCTQAKGTVTSTELALPNMCSVDNNYTFFINTDFATLEEWKAHLAENPMTVIYELAEEEVTALPTTDQIALNSLLTYDGATYLEWDCYLEPTFSGKYGTSGVGGYTLESLLIARNNEIRLNALVTE